MANSARSESPHLETTARNHLMRLLRSRPTLAAPAQRAFRAVDSTCACGCDLPSQGGACLPSPPTQTVLASQEDHRALEGAGPPARQQRWPLGRSGVLLALACLTSPCCTPVIVPLLLSLIAGTPAAVWFTQHGGWMYGVLTGVSLLSAVLGGLSWMRSQGRSPGPGAGSTSTENPASSLRSSDQEAVVSSSDT